MKNLLGTTQVFGSHLRELCAIGCLLYFPRIVLGENVAHDDNGKERVKITGDGTTLGEKLNVVNFVFCLTGEDTYTSMDGNYLLSFVPGKQTVGRS